MFNITEPPSLSTGSLMMSYLGKLVYVFIFFFLNIARATVSLRGLAAIVRISRGREEKCVLTCGLMFGGRSSTLA